MGHDVVNDVVHVEFDSRLTLELMSYDHVSSHCAGHIDGINEYIKSSNTLFQ